MDTRRSGRPTEMNLMTLSNGKSSSRCRMRLSPLLSLSRASESIAWAAVLAIDMLATVNATEKTKDIFLVKSFCGLIICAVFHIDILHKICPLTSMYKGQLNLSNSTLMMWFNGKRYKNTYNEWLVLLTRENIKLCLPWNYSIKQ